MEDGKTQPPGPDLTQGIALADLPDGGKLLGHVGEEQVLLARRGAEIFAIGAVCTHYSGPLAEGLIVDETIRCPWHHACFSLRTGEALHAPAFSPVDSWLVDQSDGKNASRSALGFHRLVRVGSMPACFQNVCSASRSIR